MFEILNIFGNFWTKNKWHFFEFAAFENRIKFHDKIKQINGVVRLYSDHTWY